MSNTVWDSISKDLLAKVEVPARGLNLTPEGYPLDRHWCEKFQNHNDSVVEELEYALAEATDAVGAQALGNLMNRGDWQQRAQALEIRRNVVYRELERLDNLITIIADRQRGELRDQGGAPTAYAWKDNPSITLTDDQVSTVKEHTS